MARGITQQQVNEAADAVLQRGERPTIEKVRAELGTGSPNTLIRMIDAWWADLAQRLAAQARANLPGLPEGVQRAMLTVWSEAVLGSRAEAATAASDRETSLSQQLATVEAKVGVLTESLTGRDKEIERLRRQVAGLEADRAADQTRLSGQEITLGQALASVDALQRQLHDAHQQAAAVTARHQLELDRAVQTEQRWLREVDRAREELKEARRHAKAAADTLERERARFRSGVERLEAELRKWKGQCEQLRKAKAKAPAFVSPRVASRRTSATKVAESTSRGHRK